MLKSCVVVEELAPLTSTVNLNVPSDTGLPVIDPVDGSSDSPPGKDPDDTDQL